MTKKYRKSIFLAVYARKKEKQIEYLLLKRKLHWRGWEFPKGGIENKETIKHFVFRELKEETGLFPKKPLNIINHHKSGRFLYDKELKNRPGIIGQTYKLYSVEVNKKKVKINKNPDSEHEGYKWVDYKKALKMLRWPNQITCLKKVNNFLETS